MASVDTSLPDKTTGAATKLAAKHANDHPLKLYGGWFCPFVQRSWIVLCEKNIPHQYIEINPYKKAPDFLSLNPRGLVPTLAVPVDGNGDEQKPLYESSIICEYLNDEFSDESQHGPNLFPAEAYERAWCRLWIDHISNKIVPGFYRLLQHSLDKEYTIDDARSNFLGHIKTFVKEMRPGGPWFLGEHFSMVDVMLAPWGKRLFLIDYYKPGGTGIPAEWKGVEDEEIWKRWKMWYDAIVNRQSVLDTWSDDEYYIKAYKRYADDTTQSEVAKATRKDERLP